MVEIIFTRKPTLDVIITRHQALVEYCKEIGLIGDDVEIITHASPEAVKDKHVLGVLPHSLSCLCATFTEIPLSLPPEMRGKELSIEDMRKYAQAPMTYKVIQLK